MWFKNLQLFTLPENFHYNATQLAERFTPFKFKPCPKSALYSYGWYPPLDNPEQVLVTEQQNCLLLSSCREQKILPAQVINEKVAEKVKAIEQQEDRKLSRQEKRSIKEDVAFELLPQAFTRKQITSAYIDLNLKCVLVNSSNRTQAENLLTLVRDSLNRFPSQFMQTKHSPMACMTDWLLNHNTPHEFSLEDTCELFDPNSKAQVKCYQVNISRQEINTLLKNGFQVKQLRLNWQDKISFVLTHELVIKQIRYLEVLQEYSQQQEAETQAEKLLADFFLMQGEFKQLLQYLFQEMGGIASNAEDAAISELMQHT
jgi:recombination associated protein RdgC